MHVTDGALEQMSGVEVTPCGLVLVSDSGLALTVDIFDDAVLSAETEEDVAAEVWIEMDVALVCGILVCRVLAVDTSNVDFCKVVVGIT